MTQRSRNRVAAFSGLLLALVLAAGCSDGGTRAAPPIPGRSWKQTKPAAVGIDAGKLAAIAAQAERANSNCLVVVRDGKLAGEWYFRGTGPNTEQEVFSATKSYASTLIGIAQDDGDLRIDESASKWIGEWRGTPADAVTVRSLLSNDSGREWNIRNDYAQMLVAPNKTAFAVSLPQTQPPGEVWAYNNSAIQTLQRVLQNATGEDVVTFAQKRLFAPLGMRHSRMTTDSVGDALMFMGLQSTCRDMARFGTLMLNYGRWGARQVVSEEWVRKATGRSSTKLNAAYGFLWWLNRNGVIGNPRTATSLEAAADPTTRRGRLVPGAPADMYWALGLGNQIIQVDPGSKTVVVRLGPPALAQRPPTFTNVDTAKVVTQAVTNK